MISVNDIYTMTDGKGFRVLWISLQADTVFAIELTDNKLPVQMNLTELREKLRDTEIQICNYDSYVNCVPEDGLTEKDKKFRDSVWNLIQKAVEMEPAIYYKKYRGEMIAELSKNSGISMVMIYKYLKWYWQRGKNKNALLPKFKNRGGKGKERKSNEKKRGRPRKYEDIVGKNVDNATKQIFEQAIKKYYHTRQEYSFKAAYEMMVKEYYTFPAKQPDGNIRNELLNVNEIPTLGQFRYWYSKRYNIKEKLIARKGQKQYDLNHRAVLGKSDTDIRGPGAQYQIDATVGDIYLPCFAV